MQQLPDRITLDLKLNEISKELEQDYSLSYLVIEKPHDFKNIYVKIIRKESTENIIKAIINKLKEKLKMDLKCDLSPYYGGRYNPRIDMSNDPNAYCIYELEIK